MTRQILNLSKGSILDLTKAAPSMKIANVHLSWEKSTQKADLDLSAFLLDDNGRVLQHPDIPSNIVWYKNTKVAGCESSGDQRNGGGEGETIKVEFDKLKRDVSRIVFAVTIHEAVENRLTFSAVSNPKVHIFDDQEEIANFPLSVDFAVDTSAVLCELYQQNGWHFRAIAEGRGTEDLNELLESYL